MRAARSNWRSRKPARRRGNQMHYLAGALLLTQFALIWLLDKAVALKGLDYVAIVAWLVAMVLIFLPMLTLHRKGQVPSGESFVRTETLVDSGIYALVRHPLYLGWVLMYLVIFCSIRTGSLRL
ncbi:MAG: hypothetical protein ACP5JJ_01030 [Anaerolineae bacterium]